MLSGPPPQETPLRDHPNNAYPSTNNKGADQRESMVCQRVFRLTNANKEQVVAMQ